MSSVLRQFIREAVGASLEYMKLENDREMIQRNVIARIRRGVIKNDRDLQMYLRSIIEDPLTGRKTRSYELAATALGDVPFAVWEIWEKIS